MADQERKKHKDESEEECSAARLRFTEPACVWISRLAGTTSEKLMEEVKQNAASWNYLDYAPALKDRPVLIVEADDRNLSDNQAMAAALRKMGNSRVTETHLATDHVFSDHRIALQGALLEWLQGVGQKAK